MIGDADEVRVISQEGHPKEQSIFSEVPPESNTFGGESGKLVKEDQNANPTPTLDDSDDDEPVFRRKSHKKASRHILEDSDSEQEDSGIPASRPEDDEASDEEPATDDAEKENLPSTEKKKKRVISHSDSESDKSDDEAPVRPIACILDKANLQEMVKKFTVFAFTDSEDSGHERGSDEDRARSDRSSDEDSDDDPVLSEALRKKLAKGAAKKGKKEPSERKSRKAKTDAMTEIHAETQRLVRESEIRIPYHNPRPLGLSAILARAQQKQEHLTNLKKAWKTPPSTSVTPDGTTSLLSRAKALLAAKAGASPSLSKPEGTDDLEIVPASEPAREVTLEATEDTPKPETESEAMEDNNDTLPDIVKDDSEKTPPALETSRVVEDEPKEVEQEEEKEELQAITPNRKTAVSKIVSKTTLTPKLANLGVAPRLSGGPDCFIDLDDDSGEATPKPGVKDLMDRLVKHSAGRKKNKAKDVEMSSVQKVKTDDDREELKLTKFTVHLEGDGEQPDPSLEKPGAKLVKLKQTLAQKMKAKREEARQERCKLYELDNEEGFEDEEEAELTDGSDTDAEPEEDELEEEEEEAMDESEYTANEKEEKIANPFLDDEAEDDEDEDDESNLHLALEDDDTQESEEMARRPAKAFLKSALQKTNTLQLFDDDAISQSPTMSQASNKENIEVSDRPFEQLSGETIKAVNDDVQEEEDAMAMETDDDSTIRRAERPNLSLLRDKEVSVSSADNSFDTMSLIPAGQGTGKKNRFGGRQTPDLYTPSSKSSMGTVKSLSKMSDLALPIEDTQDLLGSPLQCSQGSSTPRNSFNFHGLDDSNTESHLLDEDGLIKTGGKKTTRRQLMLETNSDHDDDELLGLCSGQFTSQAVNQSSSKGNFTGVGGVAGLVDDTQSTNDDDLLGLCSGKFTATAPTSTMGLHRQDSTDVPSTQSNMDELIGLCSGQFTVAQPDSPIMKKKKKQRKRIIVHEDDDDGDDFEVASPSKGDDDMDQENMESDDDLGLKLDEESDEEDQLARAVSKKKKMRMNDFVDKEAELSGSEYDSDENYDIDEKDDVLEACSGDEDDLSDTDLRDQVGRVHMKTVIDEDKKAIRLMQEMYLPDGDLYSEGGGRVRRFRWKNVDDDDTQQDMFNDSDDEKEEDTLEAQKWRLERHEREKFLLEQQKEVSEAEPSASQVIKLGKVAFRSKKDIYKPAEEDEPSDKKAKDPKPLTNIFKVPKPTHGSFLSRGKDTLAKIAEMTKPISTNINGPRNSRSFLFSTMDKDGDDEEQKKPAPVRRSLSHQPPNQPAAKKPRLQKAATVPSSKKSIFDHLGS